MYTGFAYRSLVISALICIAACSSQPADEGDATERVNRIVESVRKATSIGFIDVTIDYVDRKLYISGHAYSSANVARLMRSTDIDRLSSVELVEIGSQNIEGRSTTRFRLVGSGVGNIRKWAGPITLKFPPSTNPAEISSDMLRIYSLNDFVFLAASGIGPQRRVVVLCPDGSLYPVRQGSYIGSERALVNEINEKSVVLLEQTGTKREVRIAR